MAMVKKLEVTVQPGLFTSEKTVSFQSVDRRHVLVVDACEVEDGKHLSVHVIRTEGETAVIELPSETFAGKSRVAVPSIMLK